MKTKIAFMGVVTGAGAIAVTPFPGDARPYKVTVDSEGVALRIMRNGLCITFK